MDVPVAVARPADLLSRSHRLASRDDRIDVAVAEMGGVHEPAGASRGRKQHGAALDGKDTVRPVRGRARLRAVILHRDVHPIVVDRALVGVRTRVEERSANRVLPILRPDRPPAERVVVHLDEVELPRDPLRHVDFTIGRVRASERTE